MNLYLLAHPRVLHPFGVDYDTFDRVIVAAKSGPQARLIHPKSNGGSAYKSCHVGVWDGIDTTTSWCDADKVILTYIGVAAKGMEPGVVLASFNAG